MSKIGNFFRNYASELKKITWFPFKSVKSSTVLVIAFVLVLSVIIGLLDIGFTQGVMALGKLI